MATALGKPGRWGWLLKVYAVLAIVVGAILVVEGGWLAVLGGSPYYLLMGLAVAVAGFLIWRGDGRSVALLAAAVAATYVWALWEVGLHGWALIPRFAWVIVACLLLGLLWPIARTRLSRVNGFLYAGAGLVAPVVMLATLLYPLIWSPDVELADPALAAKRPAAAFSRLTTGSPDANVGAEHAVDSWTAYAGSNLGNHFSPSAQITPANVGRLEQAWEYHTGDLNPPKGVGYAFQNTPTMVGRTLYVCTPSQQVVALDAATGREKWRFDPKTNPKAMAGVAASTCRGVAYFRAPAGVSECPERIFWPMVDGRVGALDAATGQLCRSFGRDGYVDLNANTGNTLPGFVGPTSPPIVMRGLMIIGTGQVRDGQEMDAPSGVVRGYDAVTGAVRWAWDVGRPGQTAPLTGDAIYTRSTPNVWSLISGDDQLGLVYLPTGNASGDFWGAKRRPFDERYTSSVVAVEAATGRERWRFATVNHDLWDYDIGPQPNLVDFPTPQGVRPALVQATKSGQIYVLDRETGRPLSPVVQRATPQGAQAPEFTAATQPFSPDMPNVVGKPHNGPEERIKESDAWGITPFDQLVCRIQYRQLRYDGQYTPPTVKGSLDFTGAHGGVNWGGVSIDIQRGLMVVNSNRLPYVLSLHPRKEMDEKGVVSVFRGKSRTSGFMAQAGAPYGAYKDVWMSPLNTPCAAPPWGYVAGVDLRTKQVVWRRPLSTGYDQGPLGVPSHVKLELGTPNNSGSLTTGGGVTFIGAGLDQWIRAFDTVSGKRLWEVRVPAGPQAAPMSYELDGRQYVVAAVGGHDRMSTRRGDSVIAWALPTR